MIDDSSFCFINCHLAAGQSHKAARNQDLAAVLEEKSVFRERTVSDDAVVFAGGGDGSMVLDHEFVFVSYVASFAFIPLTRTFGSSMVISTIASTRGERRSFPTSKPATSNTFSTTINCSRR